MVKYRITRCDSFACKGCHLVEIVASWWKCTDQVQCLGNGYEYHAVLLIMAGRMLTTDSDPYAQERSLLLTIGVVQTPFSKRINAIG